MGRRFIQHHNIIYRNVDTIYLYSAIWMTRHNKRINVVDRELGYLLCYMSCETYLVIIGVQGVQT